jgi:hypothetical protein
MPEHAFVNAYKAVFIRGAFGSDKPNKRCHGKTTYKKRKEKGNLEFREKK